VAYWKLDGNSNDSKGTNNGSDANITYSTSNGVINQGAGFDGSASGINIGNMVSGPVNVSIAAWIKTTSTGDVRIIQQRTGGSFDGQWYFFLHGGHLEFVTQSVGHGSDTLGNAVVNDGSWHHVGVSQNGNTYTFYVDGVQDAVSTNGSQVSYDGTVGGSIGYDTRDVDDYLNGDIDEVGVWNASLSAADFATLYNGGAGVQYPF
jgi:hypothetical protein